MVLITIETCINNMVNTKSYNVNQIDWSFFFKVLDTDGKYLIRVLEVK